MNVSRIRRVTVTGTLAAVLLLTVSSVASAQAYISPFIGYNFGGDAGCPEISNCENKTRNLGVAFGSIGKVFGTEAEFSFIDSFFGETPGTSSHVVTFMGNFLIAPKFGPVQPYAVAGVGLIKSHVDLTPTDLLGFDNNDFGWDIGGGIIGYLGTHFGLRGDLRHFHSFQDLEVLGLPIPISDTKLNFGRLSGGVIFKF